MCGIIQATGLYVAIYKQQVCWGKMGDIVETEYHMKSNWEARWLDCGTIIKNEGNTTTATNHTGFWHVLDTEQWPCYYSQCSMIAHCWFFSPGGVWWSNHCAISETTLEAATLGCTWLYRIHDMKKGWIWQKIYWYYLFLEKREQTREKNDKLKNSWTIDQEKPNVLYSGAAWAPGHCRAVSSAQGFYASGGLCAGSTLHSRDLSNGQKITAPAPHILSWLEQLLVLMKASILWHRS